MNFSIRNFFTSAFFAWVIIAGASLFYLFDYKDGRIQLRPDRLKFGIDLVGGTYITLSVDTEKAIQTDLYDKMQAIEKQLKEAHLTLPISKKIAENHIYFIFDSVQAINDAVNFIRGQEGELKVVSKDKTLIMKFNEAMVHRIREWAVQGNIHVLRTRLDKMGVGEITIAQQGEKNIVIELPNVDNPEKAKAMIGKAALLEIKLVERSAPTEEDILDEYDGEIPEDMEIIPGKERGRKTYYLVPKHTDITGRLLKDAYAGFGGKNGSEVVVHFKFNPEGGERFYDLTRRNIGRNLAIIVDGVVISAPRVSTPIGAEGYIQGDFTKENASELATLLKSGAFVAPVNFEEERRIGPSLGAESIRAGLLACLFGLVLLFFFSLIIYKGSGFFAFLTLLYNLLFILLGLSFLHATLTLPGIAGMVLTTGMAIDASILIFEKIKEELLTGITERKAVGLGFSDAMTVILDSNITTFLVGIVLYRFGTGPIQGFAVTMMIGIVATLITGLFFMRSLFNLLFSVFNVQKISI
jgi:preprotein translocase subunit SecD